MRCRSFVRIPFALAATMALAGCQSSLFNGASLSDPITTASISEPSMKGTAKAGKRWRANPDNIRLGMAYIGQLRALGNSTEETRVLAELTKHHPGNARLQALYGKSLLNAGLHAQAETVLRRAIKGGGADWKTYSALGSALDQQGKHRQARTYYQAALKTNPDNISVLNNLGMSYMLEGNLKQAEATLRKANSLPQSYNNARIRQNLALAIGLQGRFDEAKMVASKDLPPNMVEANMAYLQKMLSQQNSWAKLKSAKAN